MHAGKHTRQERKSGHSTLRQSIKNLKRQEEQDQQCENYLARRIVVEPCCFRDCLLSSGYDFAVALVEQCLEEMRFLSAHERKTELINNIRSSVIGKSEKGYLRHNFVVGAAPGLILQNVCRTCFCLVYGIGATYLDSVCHMIKAGERADAAQLADTTPPVNMVFRNNLIATAEARGIHLTPFQLGALVVPNTVASLSCFAWMHSFFEAVGDKQPNHNEIHLEPTDVKSVHKEYALVVGDAGEETLQYGSFINMWTTCFPHVKIREYKAVSGKCQVCTMLSEARRKHLSLEARRYITQLHAFHRTMYMGERLEYYRRRNDAMLMPSSYWSAIGDGMMQQHCVLPHRGNLSTFHKTLPQHLQGMLVHGRSIEIYRTFHVSIISFTM